MKNRTKRRGNGEGSIFQRDDGRWVAKVTNGYDASGKRRRKTVYGKTKKEVQDKLVELQQRRKLGTLTDSKGVTVAKFLERWMEDAAKPTVRPTTYERYEILIRKQINPFIGGVRLDRLEASDVQAYYSDLEEAGFSPRIRQFCHSVLRRSLGQAAKWGLVARNVCELVTPPKVPQKEIATLSKSQAADLLKAAEEDRLHALYVLALTTGMRQGELLGLQWPDLDLDSASLSVRRTTYELKSKVHVGEPKTTKSKRRIDLPDIAVQALWGHRARMLAEHGASVEWVFPDAVGGPYRRTNLIKNSFHPILNRAEIPRIRFHDLRHTAATLLLAEGIHPKVVQERLGHSKIATTLDTYSHVIPSMQREAAGRLDSLFGT